MIDLKPTISVTIFNINSLKCSIKRQNLSDWFFKDPDICYLKETHFKYKDINILKI